MNATPLAGEDFAMTKQPIFDQIGRSETQGKSAASVSQLE